MRMPARTRSWLLGWLLAASVSGAAEPPASALRWEKLTALPNPGGLGSPYAGVSNGKLLVAGGANFPQEPPWEGGNKLWYDTVYALSEPQGHWNEVGKLIRPMAYGVSATAPAGVICAGGSDLRRHYPDVFLLRLGDGGLETKALPPLPRSMANGCGAMSGTTFYVAGGIEAPNSTTALRTFWGLDLAAARPAWRELEPWPGPARMLAVAAVHEADFFLISGASLSAGAEGKPVRRYLTDVFRYHPGGGWKQLVDVPATAKRSSPSPSPPTRC